MDKTDIAHLLPTLRRICSEHLALKALLKESNEHWKYDVHQFQKAPKPPQVIDTQFRELSVFLQSEHSNALEVQKLIDALDKTNLD